MATKYVIIHSTYSTVGDGSYTTPYKWSQFIARVSAVSVDTTYRLSGCRAVSGDYIISATDSSEIIITDYEGQGGNYSPWTVRSVREQNLRFLLYGDNTVTFKNGRFEHLTTATDKYLTFESDGVTPVDFINTHLKYGVNGKISEIPEVNYKNCNIVTSANGTSKVTYRYTENDSAALEYNFYNSILHGNYGMIHSYYGAYPATISSFVFGFDNVVYSKDNITRILVDDGSTYRPTSSVGDVVQDAVWLSATVLSSTNLSAVTPSQLNYTNKGTFSEINIDGNEIYEPAASLYGGDWDGVGALYFPQTIVILSANPSSGDVPFTAILSASLSAVFSANSYSFTFEDDDSTSAVQASATDKVEHTFNISGKYLVTVVATSFHKHNTDTDTFIITATDFNFSGATYTYDGLTSAITNSAYINDPIYVSAYGIRGTPVSYEAYWKDGTSASGTIDGEIKIEHTYTSGGNYIHLLKLINGASQIYMISATEFSAYAVGNRDFYVDITRGYISNSYSGTSGNPLDYDKFLDRVCSGGMNAYYDTYWLKGYRELSASDEVINTATDKKLVIRAWDLSAFGPWMIMKDDTYLYDYQNSFVGTKIIGGLYYNKPRLTTDYYGTMLKLSDATNTYIVNQGKNSSIKMYIYETSSVMESANLVGCTMYTDTGFRVGRENTTVTLSSTSADFTIIDSVIVGLSAKGSTSACCLSIYDSTFDKTHTVVSGGFSNVSADVSNQYGWTPPSNYPFTRGAGEDYGYEQNLAWLSANPEIVKPFTGITAPPNPGKGYITYPEYDTGLFGHSRSNYIR